MQNANCFGLRQCNFAFCILNFALKKSRKELYKMDIIKPRTLSGFMELLPAKQIRFEKMTEILRNTYRFSLC